MSRSRGKSLDSFYNRRVYRPSCTLDTIQYNTPSVQLLGSVSLVQACWITACNASTRLGPSFFNSSAAIEFAPAALLFFRYFSAPYISSRLGKSMSTPSSLKSTRRVLVAPIRSLRSSLNVLSISPALGFCWLIVPRS
jgi:hypothetical protein